MRSAMKAEWIKSQTSEMDGLWRRGVFQKVLRSSLTPQDRVFTSRFHYKIKRKGGEFDKCEVRLVVQGQHMRRKGEDGVGDYVCRHERGDMCVVSIQLHVHVVCYRVSQCVRVFCGGAG